MRSGAGFLCLSVWVFLASQSAAFQESPFPFQPGLPPESFDAVFLIAGQSNASGRGELDANNEQPDPNVWMFGNDYVLKEAYEPTDDGTGQVDEVSDDSDQINGSQGHSFALRAGKDMLLSPTVGNVLLIPCAKGSTSVTRWRIIRSDPLDRTTLFGSCNNRRIEAIGDNPATAVWWYQGESDNGMDVETYARRFTQVYEQFRQEMGAGLPFITCQLSRALNAEDNADLFRIGEAQRQLEQGSGWGASLEDVHLVVVFDLPNREDLHINQDAYKELGRRVALATREHVLGEEVDGTGPRLLPGNPIEFVSEAQEQIRVNFDRPVNEAVDNYSNQFVVRSNGAEFGIASVVRDSSNDSSVIISLEAGITGDVEVTYGEPLAPAVAAPLPNVIRGETGLPTPRFGPLSLDGGVTDYSGWVAR